MKPAPFDYQAPGRRPRVCLLVDRVNTGLHILQLTGEALDIITGKTLVQKGSVFGLAPPALLLRENDRPVRLSRRFIDAIRRWPEQGWLTSEHG